MPRAALKPPPFVRCCPDGRHLPFDKGRPDARGVLRTLCRKCGCPLVCVFGRSWILSGQLG